MKNFDLDFIYFTIYFFITMSIKPFRLFNHFTKYLKLNFIKYFQFYLQILTFIINLFFHYFLIIIFSINQMMKLFDISDFE